MPKQLLNQQFAAQSATPHSARPQSNASEPSQIAQLAETVARVQARLSHPQAKKSLAPNGRARPAPASSVAQAKNYLRSTKAPARRYLRSTPDLQRHRRKCAICHHPEREMIEELFVRWHSPECIANHLEDWDNVNWVSIYRHAYALGLDAIRRRNLGFVFENILDNAADATPTSAGVVAAARAISCVSEDGRWVEPPKRIIMTTIVRKEALDATTSTEPDASSGLTEEEQNVAPFASSRERSEGRGSSSTSLGASVQGRDFAENSGSAPSSTLPPAQSSPAAAGGGEAALAKPDAESFGYRGQAPCPERRQMGQPVRANPASASGSPSGSGRNLSRAESGEPRQNASSRDTFLLRASSSQVGRSNPHHAPLAAGSREIRLPRNSITTKEKRIPNR
jgi:hypothetical protein